MKKEIFFLLVILFFYSCGDERLIDEDKFVEIYAKLLVVKETYGENTKQFLSEKQRVLAEYNVEYAQFEYSLEYYSKDPVRWKIILEKSVNYLESQKK